MFIAPNYNPSIGHITDENGNIFQVINQDGTDWDEAATVKQMQLFYAQQSS